VSGIADPFNGHIDDFRISHIQRSDGWIKSTWNSMSNTVRSPWRGPRSKMTSRRPRVAAGRFGPLCTRVCL
jgi:hypothetical protein